MSPRRHLPTSSPPRLVGLAPCAIATEGSGERVLRLLGTGVSDYNDVLVEPGFEPNF